jgi:hypothetical protein
MTHWADTLPDTLTVEQDGKPVAVRELPFVKETPDLPTFVKRGLDAHRELGSRIPLKADTPEAIASWRKDHLPKLVQAGILPEGAPATPEEYGITKPADLPEGATWNDELAKSLGAILHKFNVPKAAVPELLALQAATTQQAAQVFKASKEEGIAALKKEYGDKYPEAEASVVRLVGQIFKEPAELELFNKSGLGNDPRFLSVMMRLAPLAEADSSFLRDTNSGSGSLTGEAARTEAIRIQRDPEHPRHKAYMAGDPATVDYVTKLHLTANPAERSL